ncbi:MAG: ATPase, T2SS/T4P/T4SS family [Sutterellaceae bacterium]|nr:ATPase, T2SS/T4P/T4SS family [Burkholderiaceae bacterium]MCX7900727.1 ATPase, T2SS/T4P/T4SS family [Burkholderiaceae bacterium]MDW8429771.1 ATPase, T2SS/T4P/T4SS family [Sutterellaceae bacterium]
MDGGTLKKRLGDRLIERGLISPDQLRIALLEQQQRNVPLGETLVALGFLQEETLREVLADELGAESVALGALAPDSQALALLPREVARRYRVFPVSYDPSNRQLKVAIADLNDIVAMDAVRALVGARALVRWVLASAADIQHAIETVYGRALTIEAILRELETGEVDTEALQGDAGYEHPIVRLVDALLTEAVIAGASDIHFEPEASFVRVRYRIDGVLRQVRALHKRHWPAIVVRLKILAAMNIAESRAAQDGHIGRVLAGREVSFRAAVHPTVHGENIVLRVLDRKRGIVPLDKLGLRDTQLALLRRMLQRPEGILLVTGPTGSGKTTTLYSLLMDRSHEGVNVMTLEDPVEYVLPLIRQTAISDAVRMSFADGVRSLMRQDPDIILLGEIRDKDTAEMALRAAMTGHQVFATLHANSALRAIPRLLDLGVSPDVLAGNVIGVVGQRLVRRLCEHCRQPYFPDAAERALLARFADSTPYRAVGCEQCDHRGYRGRVALMELVRFDQTIDDMIARRMPLGDIARYAASQGYETLAVDALRRVAAGETTFEECWRVVDLSEASG